MLITKHFYLWSVEVLIMNASDAECDIVSKILPTTVHALQERRYGTIGM